MLQIREEPWVRGRPPNPVDIGQGLPMKKHFLAAIMVAALGSPMAPSGALAQERAGQAALGALSGAIVLGPVGAVAGAVVGYTAGPAIASSWGLRRSERRYKRRY
jgi:hypothetical protein